MAEKFIELSDLYLAYKKAKSDAFFENIHCDVWAYSRYEKKLHYNLRKLLGRLQSEDWAEDLNLIGSYSYAPKNLKEGQSWSVSSHFTTLDQSKDWIRKFKESGERARADFRLIISSTVDYQIISALWIIKVGHLYEGLLDTKLSYGNRLRRHPPGWWENDLNGPINRDSLGLFRPYFSAYQSWRENGLSAMRKSLDVGTSIIAATMDARRFYHNVAPGFLLRREFLARYGIELAPEQRRFTELLIRSINNWYATTPDFPSRPEGALPVGLSASKVIANVALVGFDRAISEALSPIYYGRYVDDIFLVVEAPDGVKSGADVFRWIVDSSGADFKLIQAVPGSIATRFRPKYLRDSEIYFAQDKQKVFHLTGDTGKDLVEQIEQHIRSRSSEYRMLPDVPLKASEMLTRALIASPDANLEADALRKAEAVSVRRLGFAMLLGDVEAYARDLDAKSWARVRSQFYGMVERHVITPVGIFDYFSYIVRVIGLMVACKDFDEAVRFLARFRDVAQIVSSTSDAAEMPQFKKMLGLYAKSFFQAAMQASTLKGFPVSQKFLRCLREIKKVSAIAMPAITAEKIRALSIDLLMADLGRRPYKEYWISSSAKFTYPAPPVPKSLAVQRELRLGGVRRFRTHVKKGLRQPYWPAVTFPTRPLTVSEITAIAPAVLDKPMRLERAIFALRGARTSRAAAPNFGEENGDRAILEVPTVKKSKVRIGIISLLTSDNDWEAALAGNPSKSLKRYRRFNALINGILRAEGKIAYVVFPEASIPRRWAFNVASKLARTGTSFIAGLENNVARGDFRNDALISLVTNWPGYPSSVVYLQPKLLPAHSERAALKKQKRRMAKPTLRSGRPVYRHGDHFFGVLICSDLTNIDNRRHFQGQIDTLVVLEWNRDTNSFAPLVESAAHDLHAFVVQVNSRQYGDSRVRFPAKESFERDLVRVKGGDEDYFVVAPLDIASLKHFQAKRGVYKHSPFKPLPIGFKMSGARRAAAKPIKKDKL